MPTYVAFLRAINVTGRFVRMRDLAAAFHAIGHTDARTHINSGNVVFTSAQRSVPRLERALEAQLEPRLGFRAEAFVRTAAEVQAIAARAQALRQRVDATGDVHVCLLQAAIGPDLVAALDPLRTAQDAFELQGRELYWLCLTNLAGSRFSTAALERRLKARVTLRRASMLAGLAELVRQT